MGNFWQFFLSLLALAVPFLDSNVLEKQTADRVVNLPGQPPVKFQHYAGSVKLRHNDTRALFYWFLEAETGAAEKPIVIWLNGGPGCSSVAEGAAQEIGPFLLKGYSQLRLNPFAWNKAANMLFLETPIGVGFSYSNTSKDYDLVGDHSTASDNLAFLLNWYRRFPNLKTNELYISGESYAGHYAPQLADAIMDWNKGAAKDSFINLKGIMMGNAVINDPTDFDGTVDYAWSHKVISDKTYRDIKKECDFTNSNQTRECEDAFRGLVTAYADIDMFNIYRPVCQSNGKISPSKLLVNSSQHDALVGKRAPKFDPCSDYATPYFNRPDVQRALHANVTGLTYPFWLCSPIIRKWVDSPRTVLPTIQKLLEAGQRIWMFSGEFDGRVPMTSTNYSIATMGLNVKEKWRNWYKNGQVAGQVQTYEEGLTFATVGGAGHQVPIDKPEESLLLLRHFLTNTSLPTASNMPVKVYV